MEAAARVQVFRPEKRSARAAKKEKERRTKDAQRTPAKGRKERALADAPCGAWLKHCFFTWNLAVFAEAVLMLTH